MTTSNQKQIILWFWTDDLHVMVSTSQEVGWWRWKELKWHSPSAQIMMKLGHNNIMYSVLNWNNCTEKKHIFGIYPKKLYIYTYTVIVESSKFQYIYIVFLGTSMSCFSLWSKFGLTWPRQRWFEDGIDWPIDLLDQRAWLFNWHKWHNYVTITRNA